MLPFFEINLPFRLVGLNAFLDGADLVFNRRNEIPVRRSVGRNGRFADAIEISEHAIIFLVVQRIVFVGVALGALCGQAEHGFPNRVDAIEDAFDAELLGFCAAFLVGHRVAKETRGDVVVLICAWQQVTGDLFDDKLVVGQVCIDRAYDPVTVEMVLAGQIFFVAGGVSVSRGVQPLARPPLAEVLAGNQTGRFTLELKWLGKRL